MNKFDVLIVGAGFSGSVVAERLASSGKRVLLIDQRDHIAGNAFDEYDSQGVLIHRYGPHIFHTNSSRIFNYLSQFTSWREYEHRVLAKVGNKLLPIPINQITINNLYGLELDEKGVEDFLNEVREPMEKVLTSEDVVLNSVGKDLCEKFFRGYTRKQWGKDLSELSASVAARIPIRTNSDDRYFTDSYQAIPENGYNELFTSMLEHKNITIELGVDFFKLTDRYPFIVYTGPIDKYFGYCFGKLPYRSLYFEHKHFEKKSFYQKVGTVNYPNDYDFTRITEFKHLTGQSHSGTSIVREYPCETGDPYYPVPCVENEHLYKRYKQLAKKEKTVMFVGRLAQYRYYNMDQAVAAALKASSRIIKLFGK